MFYYNALQIKENSEGEESWAQGDSDYRRTPGCYSSQSLRTTEINQKLMMGGSVEPKPESNQGEDVFRQRDDACLVSLLGCFYKLWVLQVGVLVIRALLFRVYIRAADSGELPLGGRIGPLQQRGTNGGRTKI